MENKKKMAHHIWRAIYERKSRAYNLGICNSSYSSIKLELTKAQGIFN